MKALSQGAGVDVADGGVGLEHRWRTLRDHLPGGQHVQPSDEVAHHVNVVIDHHDRGVEEVAHLMHDGEERRRLGVNPAVGSSSRSTSGSSAITQASSATRRMPVGS